jgi:cellulose synthase operon protein C
MRKTEPIRVLDLRLLAALLGALAVLAVAVYWVHGAQVRRHSGALKQRAEQAETERRYAQAARYYQLYLSQVPEDVDARIGWAQALERRPPRSTREWLEIFTIYEDVLRRNDQLHDIRRRCARIALYQLHRVSDARAHLDKLFECRQLDGELEQLEARCTVANTSVDRITDSEFDVVLLEYQDAIERAPHHIPSYTELAELQLNWCKSPGDADQTMDALVAANEGDLQAHLVRAQYYLQERRMPEKAKTDTERALTLAPRQDAIRDPRDRLYLSECLLLSADVARSQAQQQQPDADRVKWLQKARAYLQQALELNPHDPAFYEARAHFDEETDDPQAALACVERGLEAVRAESRLSLLRLQAVLLIRLGKPEGTIEAAITAIKGAGAPADVVGELRARASIAKRDWQGAIATLEAIRPRLAPQSDLAAQIQFLLGRCYESMGDLDRALASYREALKQRPDLSHAPDNLRANLAGRGNVDETIVLQAHEKLAAILARRGKLDEGVAEYRLLQQRYPTIAHRLQLAHLLTVQNARRSQDSQSWDEVDQLLNNAGSSVQAEIRRSEVELVRGYPAQAEQRLRRALKSHPKDVELWSGLVALAQLEDKKPRLLPLLDEAAAAIGDRLELRLARARYWIASRDKQAAAALTKLEQNLDKFSLEDQVSFLHALARSYYAAQQLSDAERVWTILKKPPYADLHAMVSLFDLAIQRGQTADQRHWDEFESKLHQQLDEIEKLDGEEGPLYLYCAASLLLDQARRESTKPLNEEENEKQRERFTTAQDLLVRACAARSGWAAPVLRLAELYALDGNQEMAIEKYELALELGEHNPQVIQRLLAIYKGRHDVAKANRLFAKFQQSGDVPDELLRWKAEVALENNNSKEAVEEAQRQILANPKNPHDHLWYAQVLAHARPPQIAEAEKEFQLVVETLEGGSRLPEAWVAWVQFLVDSKQPHKIDAVLQNAATRLPPEVVPLVLAQCYEAMGQHEKAKQQYEAALKARPDDMSVVRHVASFLLRIGRVNEAAPYLRQIVESPQLARKGDVQWARRGLALALAESGDYQSYPIAEKYLDENLKETGPTVEDQRTRASVLATRPDRRKEAIQILEELLSKESPTDEQLLVLARLYDSRREWKKARQTYGLLAARGENASYINYYIRSLLRSKENAQAEAWLKKLEKLEPQATQTLELRVLLLKAQGHEVGDAIEKLSKVDLSLAAALCEIVGEPAKAELLYRRLAAQSPSAATKLAYADFLGRQGQTDQALDSCERVWSMPAASAEAVGNVCVAILNASNSHTEAQCRRVAKRLQEAIDKEPNRLSLHFQLAAVRSLEGKYGEAETLYRAILQQDARNWIVMNNLAWLLAVTNSKPTEALFQIEKAIRLAGPLAELLDTRAVVRIALAQPEDAIKDLSKAIDETPAASMYFHLAQAQLLANRRPEAVQSFQAAHDLNLTKGALHPLEQPAFRELAERLAAR